jgi:hypothetical protein
MTSPDPSRIDRAALDRIIQRAAELQTGERDIGENLTAEEVLELGTEVGIPRRYLQQAILEHQTTAVAPEAAPGLLGRVVGPAEVWAQRVVQGSPEDALGSLMTWMERNELLVVQRQQAGRVTWEPLTGMQAAIRRGTAALDSRKPRFMLSRAETVAAAATALERGYAHVTLSATLRQTRSGYLVGATVAAGLGGAGSVALGLLGLGAFAVAAPLVPAGLITLTVLKSFRPVASRVQLGLERALDHLERGGVKPAHESLPRGPGLLDVIGSEIRRALSAGERRAADARRPGPGPDRPRS